MFGAQHAAALAGYLHDIGKVSCAFQAYIAGAGPSPDHSTAGAVVADSLYAAGGERLIARLVAFAIAGHHAGLSDGVALETRLARELEGYSGWEAVVPPLPVHITPSLPGTSRNDNAYRLAFLGRMLFSCLVDADFIETEQFYAAVAGDVPTRGGHASLTDLRDRLNTYMAPFRARGGTLNARRAEILSHARRKAALPPGLFTMTVPTGGGKTLASLAFALDHAIRHGLARVVYVVPYTSIIEQTAGIFRAALGDADVLEHHGTVDWDAAETDADGREALAKLRRASENWDVPIVVTTAVQFFESLHANRTSRCRKLHNLANSVIVLDEAQTLPVPLLRPCLAAIEELAATYRASVVLCTATQPALRSQDGFKDGLDIPAERELAPDPQELYCALRRVAVEHIGAVTDADIAARFAAQDRMLCIVNSRKHAQVLFGLIADLPGARHLTTLMCPAHRRKVLAEIRAELTAGHPARLVSTSLVEAGVDIDFPEVWRAENGLDTIAQAAGRCNREGAPTPGRTVIFAAADHKLPAMFNQQVAAMKAALRQHADDPLGLAAVRTYFSELYWSKGEALLDAATIESKPWPIMPAIGESLSLRDLRFTPPYAGVAQAFRMIDDIGHPVIVRWRGGDDPDVVAKLVATLEAAPVAPGAVLRRLQQYTVSIPQAAYRAMLEEGAVQPISGDRYGERFMLVQDIGLYSEATGLALDPFGGGAWMGAF
ncbi:CRISPR-associated endonuclease Cas3'' [Sphingomonas sp. 3-13AW]